MTDPKTTYPPNAEGITHEEEKAVKPNGGEMGRKVAVVSGATSGIGRVLARELARVGAIVVVMGRTTEKAKATSDEIHLETRNPQVEYVAGDLSSQLEVRRVSSEILGRHAHIDVLVNNAGAVFAKRRESADHIEMTLALNVLAPFLLTRLLFGGEGAQGPSRVVNVASEAHRGARIDFNDLQLERRYAGFGAYSKSKLALLLQTYEFARRFSGTGITVNALHPGFVATRFGQNNPGAFGIGIRVASLLFGIRASRGAETPFYVATAPELEGMSGRYFIRRREVPSSKESYDLRDAQQLREVCSALTGAPETG